MSAATAAPSRTQSPARTHTPWPRPTFHPIDARSARFAVIGDYGERGDREAEVASLVRSWRPEFIITTGDNNYRLGQAESIDANVGAYYHDFIFPYRGAYGPGADRNRFFPTLGNHDWYTADAKPYLDYFTLPGNERYYDFTWGPVQFFALDSYHPEPDGITADSVQASWLRRRLAASTSCWRVVYFHHPPYSSGATGAEPKMRWPYKEWGADVVLNGHEHAYERLNVDDLTYITNGLGGTKITMWGKTVAAGSVIRYNASHGAMRVTVTRPTMTFELVTTANQTIDRHTISGRCPA